MRNFCCKLYRRIGSQARFLTTVQGIAGNLFGGESNKAAIKLIEANAEGGEAQIARWQAVRETDLRALIRFFRYGSMGTGAQRCCMLVWNICGRNLSQILPERA